MKGDNVWQRAEFSKIIALCKQATKKRESYGISFLFLLLAVSMLLLGTSAFWGCWSGAVSFSSSPEKSLLMPPTRAIKKPRFLLQCAKGNATQTCPRNYPTVQNLGINYSSPSCPDYFKWIYEDLRPWRESGVTREMVESAQRTAHFRLVILSGRAYVQKYRQSIQTRDLFTLWGILQLLRRYPGRLPDLELMFDCDDRPVVRFRDFSRPNASTPPLFRYCADAASLDIVFPDWSFWGWGEINIKPWASQLKDIKEGSNRTSWKDRAPYAYWKGNPHVAPTRKDLLKCNLTDKDDWNARLYIQDWGQEGKQGFKQSKLGDQCTHRYKIYIEGWAWSVSEKYILACNSMALMVRPRYYDFFTRGMLPLHHFWPIRDSRKCISLKFAVHWGNGNPEKAQAIGEAGSNFMHEEVRMDFVYDYMFHLLNEYAKLLRFKPTIPTGAIELCSETLACPAEGRWRKFMLDSMVKLPAESAPCSIPPAYDPQALREFVEKKSNLNRLVELWENEYGKRGNNKQNS